MSDQYGIMQENFLCTQLAIQWIHFH